MVHAISMACTVGMMSICAIVAPSTLLGRRRDDLILPRKSPIIKALTQEDDVGDGIVDGQDNHGGKHALQDSTENVEDIAGEPDDDELEGQAVGRRAAEVLDDLWTEDDDPARYGYGPANPEMVR